MGQNISVKARLNKCGKYPQWNITKPLNVTAITTTTKKTCGTFTQWNEYYPAKKYRRNSYTSWCMDGTGERYAKWNKPGGEGQIPYDLTCKLNLINKTKKWAKEIQRHRNKEQTDSHQKGGEKIMGARRGRVIKKHI